VQSLAASWRVLLAGSLAGLAVVALAAANPLSFFEIADVSHGVSVGMTFFFLAACLATVWWIFRTGYKLKK